MDAIYVSNNSFKVIEDRTAEFSPGRRVKLDCGLDGVKYAAVVSSSYSPPYTTVVIDESDLTASLTNALYGVTQAGDIGSLPNHPHDGSEGSGATISGTDDHAHAAYAPWDFGSGTISGTGDIYCNDIYTSSGTVYIGDLKLSTDGSNLLVDDQPIEAAGGSGGSTTLSGLLDTPDIYDDGKYLRSTASGTEWATVSGAGGGASTLLELTDTPSTYDEGKFLMSTISGTEWATVSGAGSSDGWTYSDEAATTAGTIVTFDGIPSGVNSIELMLAGVSTSNNSQPPIIQLGDAGGIETADYDVSNETGSQTDHTTDGWHTTIDGMHLIAMAHYGSLKLRKFIPSQELWLGEYHFMVSGGNNVRYGSGFKTLSDELTSIALTTPGGSATFTGGSATIRYK